MNNCFTHWPAKYRDLWSPKKYRKVYYKRRKSEYKSEKTSVGLIRMLRVDRFIESHACSERYLISNFSISGSNPHLYDVSLSHHAALFEAHPIGIEHVHRFEISVADPNDNDWHREARSLQENSPRLDFKFGADLSIRICSLTGQFCKTTGMKSINHFNSVNSVNTKKM